MFRLADDLRVYLHREPIDFRAGINSLAILVEQSMGLNPFERGVFAFCNRRRTRMKLLFFDRSGFVMVLKALTEEVYDFGNRHLDRPALYGWCTRLAYYLLVADIRLGGSGEVEGSWHGNDTIWRTCLDLNRVLLWMNADGQLRKTPQRAELSLVDAVIVGQGDGPLKSDPLPAGTILAAMNPASADWIAAMLLGFDPRRIPIIDNAFSTRDLPITGFSPHDIRCLVNGCPAAEEALRRLAASPARTPVGWEGYCEL